MPLRDDLLNPISGANPGGENLRYAPVYDKIKEARREDDDAAQGEWKRERKLADWPLAIKLISESLATRSKDLQLTAWLSEAMLRKEGVSGLRESLDLICGLIETFWDTLYPELEDGDAEFRAAPLQWVGDRLEIPTKSIALTRSGLDWYKYKESRAVPSEEDAGQDEGKLATRTAAIAEGKITVEEFDTAFAATPKAFYENLEAGIAATEASVSALTEVCDQRFGNDAPTFSGLSKYLEEVRQSVRILLVKKRELEPGAMAVAGAEPAQAEAAADDGWGSWGATETASSEPAVPALAVPAPAKTFARRALTEEPADREDAIQRTLVAARWLRREDPYSPAPYLMLRGLRWGELRAHGDSPDPSLLEAPPSEIRQQLKRMAMDGNWAEVLETAEFAVGMPCGRGWLDLHRYVCRACQELGEYYVPISLAVKSGVRALLADIPGLSKMSMMDDTPTANGETQTWLKDQVVLAPAVGSSYLPPPLSMDDPEPGSTPETLAPPDAFELAMNAASGGRVQEAFELLSREIAHERSGRGRFHRKVQLAQVCVSTGHEGIAYPILNSLAHEVESRKLEEWEAGDVVAQPLAMLYRCLNRLDRDPDAKQRLYDLICRLDPVQALSCLT